MRFHLFLVAIVMALVLGSIVFAIVRFWP